MLNKKLVADNLRRIAATIEGEDSIFQKADELLQSSPAKFKKLWSSRRFVLWGPFDSLSISAVLPSELDANERMALRNSQKLCDSKEEWLDADEYGIVEECSVDPNPRIYLRVGTFSIGAVDYIGLSSFSSHPFSSKYLKNSKRVNKKTFEKEKGNEIYHNPLLNVDKEISAFLQSIID